MINAKVKYINSVGTSLDLSGFPYLVKTEELFDWEWDYDLTSISNTQSNVTRFFRSSKEKDTTVWFYANDRSTISGLVDDFFEVTEYDVIRGTAGKLVVNDNLYIECFIVKGQNRKWGKHLPYNARTVTFLFPHPFWIDKQEKIYQPDVSPEEHGEGNILHLMSYPYQYNYGYDVDVFEGSGGGDSEIKVWSFNGISSAPFVMEMYGEATNPRVNIDGHLYQVKVSLNADDKVVIDSNNRTVTLYRYVSEGGNVINAYMYQNFNSDIFQQIPCGRNIMVSSPIRFSLRVYAERSEPKWT